MENNFASYLVPHPPIIIPNIGHGEEKKISHTIHAYQEVAEEIKQLAPDTIIVVTPHGPLFQDAIALSNELIIYGDLKQFRAPEINMTVEIDHELTEEIIHLANKENIPTIGTNSTLLKQYGRVYQLDHGSIVPLYFIRQKYTDFKLVHITYGMLSDIELYQFGRLIKKAIKNKNRKTVFIASGDLSHRLTEDGPYSYSPKGEKFDHLILSLLEDGLVKDIFKMNKHDIEEAGECGFRSILILLGVIGQIQGERLSYEGPFGVGYGIMKFKTNEDNEDLFQSLIKLKQDQTSDKKNHSDDYVKLARASLEYYFNKQQFMSLPQSINSNLINEKAGVFVSLKKQGYLRGCIGTFLPTTDCIGNEIIHNAISAAIDDPRFHPVDKNELDEIDISVDVLSTPIEANRDELDPQQFGVIVSQGRKRGLLLPKLEGVNTVDEQLKIACEKAGINPTSQYHIEKFMVTRHIEGEVGNE